MLARTPLMHTGYELRSSGRCAAYITSINECNKAAAALSLKDCTMLCKDPTASSVNTETEPPGCYFYFGYALKMNTAGSTASCSGSSECLCKTLAPTAGPTAAPSPAPTGPPSFAPSSAPSGMRYYLL